MNPADVNAPSVATPPESRSAPGVGRVPRPVWPAVLVGLGLVLALSVLAVPDSRKGPRFRAQRRACAANVMAIIGAMEQAELASGPAGARTDLGSLVARGFLATPPVCPVTGTTSYSVYSPGPASEAVVTCLFHGDPRKPDAGGSLLDLLTY